MFCKDFSIIAAPITRLTKKDIPFKWGPEQKHTQETIIQQITNAPVLIQPDPTCQFELESDASLLSTGAVLYQHDPPQGPFFKLIPPPSPTIWLIPTLLVHLSSLKRPCLGVGLT